MNYLSKRDQPLSYHDSQKEPHIAVVIPAYLEERLLPITLAGIPHYIQTIIVVDDASTDRTRLVAQNFAKQVASENTEDYSEKYRQVRVLSLPKNSGVGRAICVGYLEALGLGADIAVVVGADAQMDPNEIRYLVDSISSEVCYVKGDRMQHPEVRKRMPSIRYWGNRILSWTTGYLMSYPTLSDAQCGFTALKLECLSKIPLAKIYPRYGFPNDLLLRLAEAKVRIAQVPVTPIYASEQSKLSIPKVLLPLSLLFIRALGRKIFSL